MQRPPGTVSINVISAFLAFVVGVIDASLLAVTAGSDVRPSLMFASVVGVTVVFGLGTGAIWAFVGGLTVNLLSTDPLGIVPLGLLIAAGVAAALVRTSRSAGPWVALAAGALGSVAAAAVQVVGITLLSTTGPDYPAADLAIRFLPTALANSVLTLLAWGIARAVGRRLGAESAAG